VNTLVKVLIKGDTLELDGKPEEIMRLLKLFMTEGMMPVKNMQLKSKDREKLQKMIS